MTNRCEDLSKPADVSLTRDYDATSDAATIAELREALERSEAARLKAEGERDELAVVAEGRRRFNLGALALLRAAREALGPFAAFGSGIPEDQNGRWDKQATFAVDDYRAASRLHAKLQEIDVDSPESPARVEGDKAAQSPDGEGA